MGNYLSKEQDQEQEQEQKEPLTCTYCTRQNIEPAYFTKKPNNILVEKIKNSKVEETSCTPSFIYVCSNGHKLHNY